MENNNIPLDPIKSEVKSISEKAADILAKEQDKREKEIHRLELQKLNRDIDTQKESKQLTLKTQKLQLKTAQKEYDDAKKNNTGAKVSGITDPKIEKEIAELKRKTTEFTNKSDKLKDRNINYNNYKKNYNLYERFMHRKNAIGNQLQTYLSSFVTQFTGGISDDQYNTLKDDYAKRYGINWREHIKGSRFDKVMKDYERRRERDAQHSENIDAVENKVKEAISEYHNNKQLQDKEDEIDYSDSKEAEVTLSSDSTKQIAQAFKEPQPETEAEYEARMEAKETQARQETMSIEQHQDLIAELKTSNEWLEAIAKGRYDKNKGKSDGEEGGLLDSVLDLGSNLIGGKKGGLLKGGLKAAGGLLSKGAGLGKMALGAAKFLGPLGLAVTAGKGLYDGFTGAFDDEAIMAREGKDPKDITAGDRIKHGAASALSGLTFGLLEKDSIMNVGESFTNFFSGKGWNTNKDLKDQGIEDTGKGLFDTMIDASPIGLMKDAFTGNLENNSLVQGVGSLANSALDFFGFGGKKKVKKTDEDGNEIEVEEEKSLGEKAKDAFIEATPVGWIGKKLGFWGKDKEEEKVETEGTGTISPEANKEGGFFDRISKELLGDDASEKKETELLPIDADKVETEGTGQPVVINNNNNTTVAQSTPPRFRMADQSSMAMATQGV